MTGRVKKLALGAALGLSAIAALAPAAQADDSLIRISEVYSDDSAAGDADFVEMQVTAAGQQIAAGHYLYWFGSTGTLLGSAQFPPNSTLSDNQRTILVTNTPGGPSGDFEVLADGLQLTAPGGAACLSVLTVNVIDCVSWGTYTGGSPAVQAASGTPAGALSATNSVHRSLTPNCATLLEPADDTNNSAVDFFLAPPTPRLNGVAPTEFGCLPPAVPTTSTTPKKKCKKKKGKKSSAAAAKKKCKKKKKR